MLFTTGLQNSIQKQVLETFHGQRGSMVKIQKIDKV